MLPKSLEPVFMCQSVRVNLMILLNHYGSVARVLDQANTSSRIRVRLPGQVLPPPNMAWTVALIDSFS